MFRLTALAVVLSIASFYLARELTADLWVPVNAAGIIGLTYLLFLTIKATRSVSKRSHRVLLTSILGFSLLSLVATWGFSWEEANHRAAHLVSAKRQIYHWAIMNHIERRLTTVMLSHDSVANKESIGATFRRTYPNRESFVDSFYISEFGDISISNLDTAIVLLAEAKGARGVDPTFVNLDGRRGFAQHHIRMTASGVFYVVQN